MLFILLVLVPIELICIYLSPIFHKLLSPVIMGILVVDTAFILSLKLTLWTILIAYFSIFRLINLYKLADGRKQSDYLRSSCLRSSLSLGVCQLVVLGGVYLFDHLNLSYQLRWQVLITIVLAGLLILGMSMKRALVTTRPKIKSQRMGDNLLPSLTVAIPARNETSDLEECLRSLIDSDYPKLEILVLDDCSQVKRTPEIIRGFAHNGVRFLKGEVPPENWTAKNFAYEQLSEEANGEIILFSGVDVRFSKDTIRKMVELKQRKAKSMVSFMPVNELSRPLFKALIIQPIRYLWEISLPRRSLNRPPVLSTCWMINRSSLLKNGGFKAVSRSVLPERYFARQTALNHDGYSFVALGKSLGLSSVKSYSEQLETAVRTKYPLLKQRPENVAVICLGQMTLFISPVALTIYGLVSADWWLAALSALAIVLARIIFAQIFELTYDRWSAYSFLATGPAMAWDIGLNLYSMWGYEFSHIDWKGRNVCVPVMQIVDSPLRLSQVGNSNVKGRALI